LGGVEYGLEAGMAGRYTSGRIPCVDGISIAVIGEDGEG